MLERVTPLPDNHEILSLLSRGGGGGGRVEGVVDDH